MEEGVIDIERAEEEAATDLLRDRFRLCTISIAEAEAKQNDMEISQPIMACVSNLAFKYAEQLAKDLELFAQHAGRKTVNMEDVILSESWSRVTKRTMAEKYSDNQLISDMCPYNLVSAHRNEHLSDLLRNVCNELKAKELQSEKKKKKGTKKRDKAAPTILHIPDP